jgi:hypothetical protein
MQEDCLIAIMRMLEIEEYPFFHVHFKDYTFAVALKRLGFQLYALLLISRWLC